jgi:type IV pilus assembly protein PilW
MIVAVTYKLARKRTAGFSLVEIMVAMVISLVILGGAMTILVQNQQHYRQNDDFGRLQENARFAMDLITGDLRLAGYWGCPAKVANQLVGSVPGMANYTPGNLLDTTYAVDGYDDAGGGVWGAQGNADLAGTIWPGTDAITIRKLRDTGTPIAASMAAADDDITFSAANPPPIVAGQLAAIYDCQRTNLFQATGVAGQLVSHALNVGTPGNTSDRFAFNIPANPDDYQADHKPHAYEQNNAHIVNAAAGTDLEGLSSKTFVASFEPVRYYIAASTADPARPALWREFHDNTQIVQQELIEGVENMQILYGRDDDGSGAPTTYVTANNVSAGLEDDIHNPIFIGTNADWFNVVAVKINLLVSTLDEVGTEVDNKTYDINGTPNNAGDDLVAPLDRRSRKLVSVTVLLRNMQAKVGNGPNILPPN